MVFFAFLYNDLIKKKSDWMCLGFTKSGGGLQLFFLHVLTKYAVSADVP